MQINRTLIAICLLLAGVPARSATWYVTTNGVDNADPGRGESWDLPYATISNAIAKAADNDAILVSNGLYQITVSILIAKPLRLIGVDGPENTALNAGGITRVVAISATNALLAGFTITNGYLNTSGQYGAGIRLTGGSTISNCIISGNNNASRQGGGIFCSAPLDTTGIIVQCSINGNLAPNGAGLMLTNNVIMSDCQVAGNRNTSSHGGGIYLRQGQGNAIIRNCTIVSNIAVSQGGGLWMIGGGLVENCEFYGNQSLADTNSSVYIGGGAIYVQIGEIRNCLFTTNVAANNGGGILLHGAAKVYNCTFAANAAGRWGGGFYQHASSPDTLENTILWYNSAVAGGDNWFCYNRDEASSFTNNCLGWGAVSASVIPYDQPPVNYGGGFNITNDPAFVNSAGGSDCRLRYGSPCINAALHYAWMDDATDLVGNPRVDPAWRLPDIGCYEFMLHRGTMFSIR